MPISNYEGDVIGVAQIINKTSGEFPFFLLFSVQSVMHSRFSNQVHVNSPNVM